MGNREGLFVVRNHKESRRCDKAFGRSGDGQRRTQGLRGDGDQGRERNGAGRVRGRFVKGNRLFSAYRLESADTC